MRQLAAVTVVDSPTEKQGEDAGEGEGLGKTAVRGSVIELGSYAASQALRLGSNIILAKMLETRVFGLMALVLTVNIGLVLLSDVGLQQAVIQNKRGDEPRFYNTVWTMQVVRGAGLFVIAALLAWPMSVIYDPQLLLLVPLGATAAVIFGFSSTSEYTLRRHLNVLPINLMELGTQVIATTVTLTWAYFSPSVWALLVGLVTSNVARCIWTHCLRPTPGYRNRFCWDKQTREEVFAFGRWVLGSSSVTFVRQQSDRLLLGKTLGAGGLGVYHIAATLADAINVAGQKLVVGIFYPIFCMVRHDGNERLREIYYRARLRLDMVALPAIGVLTTASAWIVHFLFPERYADAGWMLQLLAIRTATLVIVRPAEQCLVALGKTRYGFFGSLAGAAWIVVGIGLGWHFFGVEGVLWAVALSEMPALAVLWPPMIREGLLRPQREALAVGFYLVGLLLGWGLSALLPEINVWELLSAVRGAF